MQCEVSAVLLAAGLSERMGFPKQLLILNDKPLIRHCLDSIIAAGVKDIVAVLRHNGEKIKNAIADLPVKIALNKTYGSEMAESVRTGIREINPSSTGILVCLSDHPLVSVKTFKELINLHDRKPGNILVPVYNGKNGHPALFPEGMIREVLSGINLRETMNRHAGSIMFIDVDDEGVIIDIDTMEDYKKILEGI